MKKIKGLIIPDMEPIENIQIEKPSVQQTEIVKDKPKETETKNEQPVVSEKTQTNTEELLSYYTDTIKTLKEIKFKFHRYFDKTHKSIKNRLLGRSLNVYLDTPVKMTSNLWENIIGGTKATTGWFSFETATQILVNYLSYYLTKFNKMTLKKIPFINDQHFALSYGNVIINDNERLTFLENTIKQVSEMRDTLCSYEYFDEKIPDVISDLFTQYIDGLSKSREKFIELTIKGKSFSELTKKLQEINL